MKTQALPAEENTTNVAMKKILVPSDFSSASSNAFRCALRFAQKFGADLLLIHVLEPVVAPGYVALAEGSPLCEEDFATAGRNLGDWVDLASHAGVKAKLALRVGLPAHEIVEIARDHDVDLIVIATHGHTGWKHFCIGSTAERVVRAAPCPVLVVREKEHALV
jgi:nucleotide-binding universal stress UspA family protein